MADLRLAVAAILLVLVATGCSSDPDTTTAGGDPVTDTGGDIAYERVATDELSVSPDGEQVLADCWNGICRWSTDDGSLELIPDRGTVAVAPDWSTVATVDDDTVVLSDLDSGRVVTELTGLGVPDTGDQTLGSTATAVAYSPDGALLAAAALGPDSSGVVQVWSVADPGEQTTFTTRSEVHALAFSPDGEWVATAGNGRAEVHEVEGGDSEILDTGEGGTVAWSPDGQLLLASGADGRPVVWDTRTWEQVADLAGGRLHEAAFAPDSRTVALTLLDDTSVVLWGIADADPRRLDAHTTVPGAVAWSHDGSMLYSVSAEDGVRAWNADGDPAPLTFEVPEGR